MSAYIIIRINITNPEAIKDYQVSTPPIVEKYNGKFIARGGEVVTLEGQTEDRRIIMIEFQTMSEAKAFYNSPEYTKVKKLREGFAEAEFIAVEGVN